MDRRDLPGIQARERQAAGAAIETRLALLTALQEIAKGFLAATTNAERAAFVLAMQHAEAALSALE